MYNYIADDHTKHPVPASLAQAQHSQSTASWQRTQMALSWLDQLRFEQLALHWLPVGPIIMRKLSLLDFRPF